MKEKMLGYVVSLILRNLTPELVKDFLDMLLDFVEDKVLGTKSTVDDATILPLCKLARVTFNIPDND